MIRLKIELKIRHVQVCAIADRTAIVVVVSYRSVSRNLVRFKALVRAFPSPYGARSVPQCTNCLSANEISEFSLYCDYLYKNSGYDR